MRISDWSSDVVLFRSDAVEVQRVVSPKGIEAWLVQSDAAPVIAMDFAFKGGITTDPEGKEGRANLVSTLLDEGEGDLDSEEFQKRLADAAIGLDFTAGVEIGRASCGESVGEYVALSVVDVSLNTQSKYSETRKS